MKKSNVYSLRSKVFPRRRQAAFTLLELLIVIALIMVLMGLLIPAFYKVKDGAKSKKREIELRVIGSAIKAYKLQEKKFPAPVGALQAGEDLAYGTDDNGVALEGGDNSLVMNILRDETVKPPVLDPNKLRWAGDNVIDPDGNQYNIKLDLDYDGKIDGSYKEYKVW